LLEVTRTIFNGLSANIQGRGPAQLRAEQGRFRTAPADRDFLDGRQVHDASHPSSKWPAWERTFRVSLRTAKNDALIQRVNVDFAVSKLQELDKAAAELNVRRQAAINAFVRLALDQHHPAQGARKAG
jgi:hypothetical protein